MSIRLFENLLENKRFEAIILGFRQRTTMSETKYWFADCLIYENSVYYGIRSIILVNYEGEELDVEDDEDSKIIIKTGFIKTNGYPQIQILDVDKNIDQSFGINKTPEEIKDIRDYHKGEKYRFTDSMNEIEDEYENEEDDTEYTQSYEDWLDEEFGDDAETAYWNLD